MENHKEAGFSLIELSIALVIIGLILGGVLKGQELIENARLKATMAQINGYRLAVSQFFDIYDALPGDYGQAHEMIHPSLKNGNQNGRIEGPGLLADGVPDHEALSFWAHLQGANLIQDSGVMPHNRMAHFGQGAPKAKIGGGITVRYNPYPDMPGHWFLLGEENNQEGNAPLLTPSQAMSMDKKMDTGVPTTGRIRIMAGYGAPEQACIKNGQYNVQNKEPACIAYFQF